MAAILLCACTAGSTPAYETVRDTLPTCDPGDAPYIISLCVPPEAVMTFCTGAQRVYAAPSGDYVISVRVLVTDGLDAAVYALAGTAQPQLRLSSAQRRECQLAWSSETPQGPTVCRALCLMEGDFAYCLCLQMKAGLGAQYNARINALFSSFALYLK